MVRGQDIQSRQRSEDLIRQRQMELLLSYRNGFQAVHVIATGVQLGLFERLAARPQGTTTRELAELTGFHAPYLGVWCSTAYRYGLLEVDNIDRYRLAGHIDSLLGDRSSPDSMVSMMTNALTEQGPRMARYREFIKSGQVGSHAEAYGKNATRLDPPKSAWAQHRKVWTEKVLLLLPELGEALKNGGRLLDMGCGPGVMITQLAELYPKATFVGIDVVEVGGLDTARRLIAERGLQKRVEVKSIKAEEMASKDEFDGITMTSVLHEILPVELREKVFKACYRALKPGGALVVRDSPYPDSTRDLRDPRFSAGAHTQYHEMVWGTVLPTQQERRDLFAAAGFIDVEQHFIDGLPQGVAYLDVGRKV